MKYLQLLLLICLCGCSALPISVDPYTYIEYSKFIEQQQTKFDCNLIGIYRVYFTAQEKVIKVDKADAVLGDYKIAAIKRGGSIDFISLSGYKNFGAASDQGACFSVNFQGSTLWSIPYKYCNKNNEEIIGTSSGITSNVPGDVTIEKDHEWFIVLIKHHYSQEKIEKYKKNERKLVTEETLFLKRVK
jgi:hypothetical protein